MKNWLKDFRVKYFLFAFTFVVIVTLIGNAWYEGKWPF